MLPVLFLLFTAVTASPPIDCFIDQEECEIGTDNLIHTFLGIASAEECKLRCEDEIGGGVHICTAFTYFGSNSHPIPDGCLLFSSCRERRPCQNCTTGSSQTKCTCSIGSRQIGPRTVGPRTVGPRTVGPRTIGPRTVGSQGPAVRGPTVRPEKVANWAPDSWAPGPSCPGPNCSP